MSPSNEEQEESNDRQPLLATSQRPSYESRHTYSSFQDIGAEELTGSVESLPTLRMDSRLDISVSRGIAIVISLGILVVIQGATYICQNFGDM
jgi:hypothetical protein